MKKQLGFTLIELLVVIGIISALATVVFVALDPATRFKSARNARRVTDADTILAAVQQYVVDTGGSLPTGMVGTTIYQIGSCASGGATNCPGTHTACIDIGATLSSNKYLKNNPIDPNGSAASTGYSITKDANNLFTVNACLSEGTTVAVSR